MRVHLAALRRAGLGSALAVLVACAPDSTEPTPNQDAAQLYWSLTLDHRAIVLSTAAPYDTIRLTATPRNVMGEPLTGLAGTVEYRSADLKVLQVDADGLVRAVATGIAVPIVATLKVGNVTHADTAFVTVVAVASPPELATFSIHPEPPDSAVWEAHYLLGLTESFLGPKILPIQALDALGNPIPGVLADFRSSDTTIAGVGRLTGAVSGRRPGTVTITATTTVFGVTKADTLPFTITNPTIAWVYARSGSNIFLEGSEVTVTAGGAVLWFNTLESTDLELTFEDPTNVAEDVLFCFCGAGNVSLPASGFAARRFPVPGTYIYHSTTPALTGRITVTPPPSGGGSASVAALRRPGALGAGRTSH